jgi:hypothetical protein
LIKIRSDRVEYGTGEGLRVVKGDLLEVVLYWLRGGIGGFGVVAVESGGG